MNVMRRNILATIVSIVSITFSAGVLAETTTQHYHPKGKMQSKYTVELQNKQRATLPFEDKRDLEENNKGFIAAPDYK